MNHICPHQNGTCTCADTGFLSQHPALTGPSNKPTFLEIELNFKEEAIKVIEHYAQYNYITGIKAKQFLEKWGIK